MVLRTPRHSYVHRRHESDELYDREADPAEEHNLFDRPDLAEVASGLCEQLFGWLADTSDVIPWEANPRFPDIPHGWR